MQFLFPDSKRTSYKGHIIMMIHPQNSQAAMRKKWKDGQRGKEVKAVKCPFLCFRHTLHLQTNSPLTSCIPPDYHPGSLLPLSPPLSSLFLTPLPLQPPLHIPQFQNPSIRITGEVAHFEDNFRIEVQSQGWHTEEKTQHVCIIVRI